MRRSQGWFIVLVPIRRTVTMVATRSGYQPSEHFCGEKTERLRSVARRRLYHVSHTLWCTTFLSLSWTQQLFPQASS